MVGLARPRRGHFDLGTGYHGDVWLDLDALFLRPARLRPYVEWLADFVEQLAPAQVLHRLTGEAQADVLLAPLPAFDRNRVRARLARELLRRGTRQGSALQPR